MRRSTAFVAGLLAAALAFTACGSDQHSGPPPAPKIDLKSLDVGPYSTDPHDLGKPTNPDQAREIEAERLGNYLPLPMDVDPAFFYGGQGDTNVFIDLKDSVLKDFVTDPSHAPIQGMVSGYGVYARNDPDNQGIELVHSALIFPDEQQATAAATALEQQDFTAKANPLFDQGPVPDNQPVPLPKYAAAHAHWRPDKQAIKTWYATGKLVVFISVYDQAKSYFHHTDLPALVDLTQRSLDKVVPAVGKFTPHPPDKLMDQPIDMDGMLGRTLVRSKASTGEWLNPPGAYDAHAALGSLDRMAGPSKAFERNGVDKVAFYGNNLYRARDATAATDMRDQLANADALDPITGHPGKQFKRADSPKALPVAVCQQYKGSKRGVVPYYCAVSYGRYAAESWSEQLLDAQQKISAQYAMLVKAGAA